MPDIVRSDLLRGDNAALLLLTLLALTVFLLLGWLWSALRLRVLNRRLTALARGQSGQNLEQAIGAYFDKVEHSQTRMDTLEQALGVVQAQIPGCFQRAHLVRYDAFADVGGEQSFSLALLNAQNDGVVITGVHSRMDARVYAKYIQDGRPSHTLSQEEQRLLRELAAR